MRDVRTPSEINHEARLHLEAGFGSIWVEGEISNLSSPASGHRYFSLKDERAQLRCALFRSAARGLPLHPENGLLVQARGRLSLYEPRGDYQLIVDRLEAAGAGRLQAAFEALKKKLEAEGLFDPGHKQALPRYPRRIAVVTSPGGAVIRDILNVLRRRWPLAAVRLYPVPVQGAEAPAAIVRALAAANRHRWAQAVILARGGGSLEDLWAFNDEAVARAVFASALPVVSAVGHETDFSIADFVADLRAPTPSAAAELLAPDGPALAALLRGALGRLRQRWNDLQGRRAQQLDHLAHRLAQQDPQRRLARHRLDLARLRHRLRAAAARSTSTQNRTLRALERRLSHAGLHLASGRRQAAVDLHRRLCLAGGRLAPERQTRLAALARMLHALSPLPTLERGYAVVTDRASGQTITSIDQAPSGTEMVTRLRDGRVFSTVDGVEAETPSALPDAPRD